jgi:hypothetical protein
MRKPRFFTLVLLVFLARGSQAQDCVKEVTVKTTADAIKCLEIKIAELTKKLDEARSRPPLSVTVQFKVSQFKAVADSGKEDLTAMGGHKACFLTGNQDENNQLTMAAICSVMHEGGEWRLRARGARCDAACID